MSPRVSTSSTVFQVTRSEIGVLDTGPGNTRAVLAALRRARIRSQAVQAPNQVLESSHLIIPGVGAFDEAMRRIEGDPELRQALNHFALRLRRPVLGICLGMQILTNGSEEGQEPGLGWINAETVRIRTVGTYRIPHVGWNSVRTRRGTAISNSVEAAREFYFSHSYYVAPREPNMTVMTVEYGDQFAAAIKCGNIFGVQFHPEKSHEQGLRVLRGFAGL